MKRICFIIVCLIGICVDPLFAQITAIGHVSAEVVETVALTIVPYSMEQLKSSEPNISFSDSNQSFNIGVVKINQRSETARNLTIKPFFITNTKGRKMELTPVLDPSIQELWTGDKILKFKAKIHPPQIKADSTYKGYYSIIVNYY